MRAWWPVSNPELFEESTTMLMSGPYLKLTQRERDDIVLFCFAMFNVVRAAPGIRIQRRDDRIESALELIVGLMQASDLWSARFFAVAEHAEDYRRFFNVRAPAWFTDESKRSKSREQHRGVEGDAAKHRVRRWLNCQAIVEAAKASGFVLGDLGLYLPRDLVDATAEVDQWRACEADLNDRLAFLAGLEPDLMQLDPGEADLTHNTQHDYTSQRTQRIGPIHHACPRMAVGCCELSVFFD